MEQHLYTKPSVWKMPSRSYGTLDLTRLGDPNSQEQKSSKTGNYYEERCSEDERIIRTYIELYKEYTERKDKDPHDFKMWQDLVTNHVSAIYYRNGEVINRFNSVESDWILRQLRRPYTNLK